MGQCAAKLQHGIERVSSHSPSCPDDSTEHRFARVFNFSRRRGAYSAVHIADQTCGSDDGRLELPFGVITDDDSSAGEERRESINPTNTGCNIQSDRRRPLLDVRFNRTLFCEDITYEYHVDCTVMEGPQWTVRLTVEQLTDFLTETAAQWRDCHDAFIPDQCGKVMQPHVFTTLLHRVADDAGILQHEDAILNQRAANMLSIPYELRPIVQYNAAQYVAQEEEAVLDDFDHFDQCNQFRVRLEDRFKYLSHRQMVYPHDVRYDDCCTLYDAPEVECVSFWIRCLSKRVDFQFNLLSNDVFTVLMSDAAFLVADAILKATAIDEGSAWIITDFLPKEIRSEHGDTRCDAQIVYKYDPRGFSPGPMPFDDEEDGGIHGNGGDLEALSLEEDEGEFLLDDPNNALLMRHEMALEEVHALCVSLRRQCTTLSIAKSPSLSRLSSESISDFIEFSQSMTSDRVNGGGRTQCVGGIPTSGPPIGAYSPNGEKNPDRTTSPSLDGSESSMAESESSELDEQFRLFFAAFIDEEEADDVNLCQWLDSLMKLKMELTESELVAAFNFMLRQNPDSEGYVDFVDFTQFCRGQIGERFKSAQRAQHVLRSFIIRK